MPDPLFVAVSLDVEEEGLFGGQYACRRPSIRNTAFLYRLRSLTERGVRPTLFCAHSVLADEASRDHLAAMQDAGAEIGAHLHHWNTPPLMAGTPDSLPRVPAAALSPSLLADKLRTVLTAARSLSTSPVVSFRMGRWDAHPQLWPLLAQAGIQVDASVRPLHGKRHAADGLAVSPDHFDAPAVPYTIATPYEPLLEVPLSVAPLLPGLPALIRALPAALRRRAQARFHQWGALALLPVEHPLPFMRLVTQALHFHGVRLLSLTWHSSEMMPGGAPHIPDEAAAARLLDKISRWLDWLESRYDVTYLFMRDVAAHCPPHSSPPLTGDWTWR